MSRSLLTKTWRLHRVFNNTLLRVRALTNILLLKMVSVILLVEIIINIGWIVGDPLQHTLKVSASLSFAPFASSPSTGFLSSYILNSWFLEVMCHGHVKVIHLHFGWYCI
jgi:hypothetical protein